ncbi:hypothetical protein MMPV_000163 [Pyropia vietnamensis]
MRGGPALEGGSDADSGGSAACRTPPRRGRSKVVTATAGASFALPSSPVTPPTASQTSSVERPRVFRHRRASPPPQPRPSAAVAPPSAVGDTSSPAVAATAPSPQKTNSIADGTSPRRVLYLNALPASSLLPLLTSLPSIGPRTAARIVAAVPVLDAADWAVRVPRVRLARVEAAAAARGYDLRLGSAMSVGAAGGCPAIDMVAAVATDVVLGARGLTPDAALGSAAASLGAKLASLARVAACAPPPPPDGAAPLGVVCLQEVLDASVPPAVTAALSAVTGGQWGVAGPASRVAAQGASFQVTAYHAALLTCVVADLAATSASETRAVAVAEEEAGGESTPGTPPSSGGSSVGTAAWATPFHRPPLVSVFRAATGGPAFATVNVHLRLGPAVDAELAALPPVLAAAATAVAAADASAGWGGGNRSGGASGGCTGGGDPLAAVVLLGDFNAPSPHPAFAPLRVGGWVELVRPPRAPPLPPAAVPVASTDSDGNDGRGALPPLLPAATSFVTTRTTVGASPPRWVDNVWTLGRVRVSGGAVVRPGGRARGLGEGATARVGRVRRTGSDHFGVAVEWRLEGFERGVEGDALPAVTPPPLTMTGRQRKAAVSLDGAPPVIPLGRHT